MLNWPFRRVSEEHSVIRATKSSDGRAGYQVTLSARHSSLIRVSEERSVIWATESSDERAGYQVTLSARHSSLFLCFAASD
jgi:hypothetical protein